MDLAWSSSHGHSCLFDILGGIITCQQDFGSCANVSFNALESPQTAETVNATRVCPCIESFGACFGRVLTDLDTCDSGEAMVTELEADMAGGNFCTEFGCGPDCLQIFTEIAANITAGNTGNQGTSVLSTTAPSTEDTTTTFVDGRTFDELDGRTFTEQTAGETTTWEPFASDGRPFTVDGRMETSDDSSVPDLAPEPMDISFAVGSANRVVISALTCIVAVLMAH